MRILIVLVLFVIAGAFRCEKDLGEDQYTTFYYKQTQCADPWQTGPNDSATLVNVSAYLKNLGLYVSGINIKADGTAEICAACVCKTGKTIYVSSFNSDSTKARYLRLGFQQ